MDTIALILSALTAGTAAALQETAGTAVRDAYHGLTALIRKKLEKDPKAAVAVEGFTDDPETWRKPLEKSIREAGAADDAEILLAAQKMLELVKSQSEPKYRVEIQGDVQGLVQGDHAQVTMSFDNAAEPGKKRKPSRKK